MAGALQRSSCESETSMRNAPRAKWSTALELGTIFVLLTAAFLVIAFPDGGATKSMEVPATANTEEAGAILGYADSRGYIEVGHDLAVHKELATSDHYRLNFWPPGMHLFWAALFTVFGPDIPVGLAAGIALAVLFAALFTAYAHLLTRFLPRIVVALILVALVLSAVVSEGIFRQYLLLSEGLYVWWMLVCLYGAFRLTLAGSSKTRAAWALGTGAALGASAYVRTTSELLGRVLTALLVGWLLLVVAQRVVAAVRARRRGAESAMDVESRPWSRHLIALLLCMVAFHAVTIPWRIFAAQELRPGNYSWSIATNKYWHFQWTPDSAFYASGLYFLPGGGANTACHIDPARCRQIGITTFVGPTDLGQDRYRRLTLETLRAHPVEWAQRRLSLLRHAWFGAEIPCGGNNVFPTCSPPSGVAATAHEIPQNGLLLVALVAALVLSFRRMLRYGVDLLALFIPSQLVTTLVPFVFLTYEVRYFAPLKILSVLTVVLLVVSERLAGSRSERSERLPEAVPDAMAPVGA